MIAPCAPGLAMTTTCGGPLHHPAWWPPAQLGHRWISPGTSERGNPMALGTRTFRPTAANSSFFGTCFEHLFCTKHYETLPYVEISSVRPYFFGGDMTNPFGTCSDINFQAAIVFSRLWEKVKQHLSNQWGALLPGR